MTHAPADFLRAFYAHSALLLCMCMHVCTSKTTNTQIITRRDHTHQGDGNNYGNEWIRIKGATNVNMVMKVFGYAAGTCDVTYTYYH